MKKIIGIFSISVLCSLNALAQETTEETSSDYNRWSIDINGGLSRPTQPMTVGYYTEDFSLFHVDLGARYMFSPNFGLKADVGYDSYDESPNDSGEFNGTYSRINLQGVVNLGRILKFEDFTQRLNLQFHTGLGYSFMETDAFDGKDEMTNILLGLTTQFKISERIALNADFTMVNNISQHYTFDGYTGGVDGPIIEDRGFNGTLYNATLGLSIYLGKNEKHADWVTGDSKYDELEKRVAELEIMLNDTDRDGVADYLDVEPNSITGVAVDTKGRSIDVNQNGIPDELEKHFDALKNTNNGDVNLTASGLNVEELINGGYINVYFNFNSANPTRESFDAINFVKTYLLNNPSKSVDIIGFADEIGNTEYNNTLSETRANNVKSILAKSGIDSSRLMIKAKGEDTSVDASSADARRLVRRVTFKLN